MDTKHKLITYSSYRIGACGVGAVPGPIPHEVNSIHYAASSIEEPLSRI